MLNRQKMAVDLLYKMVIDIPCHNFISNCMTMTIFVTTSLVLSDEIVNCIKITVG